MIELLTKKIRKPTNVLGPVNAALNRALSALAGGSDKLHRYWKVTGPHPGEKSGYNYTVVIILVLSVLFFGLWGIIPLASGNGAWSGELEYGKVYEAALVEKINALKEGRSALSAIISDLDVLDSVIPNTPLQAELLEELSIDGGTSGFSVLSISFGERTAADSVVGESFESTFEGSAADLIEFLENISRGRLIEIGSVRYNIQVTESTQKMTITIGGKSFYYKVD